MANFIPTLFADQLMAALCNTLLYSLVYGLLLAALAALIIMLTRNTAAVTRYNLLTGALLVFTLLIAITFIVQFNDAEKIAPSASQSPTIALAGPVNMDQAQASTQESVSYYNQAFIKHFIATHRTSIVLIWFLTICVKSIQLGWGLMAVYRLKRRKVQQIANTWVQKTRELANRLSITQQVTILESELAKVPMVLGHLKPVILIPIGLFTALSSAEVEAILLHELAHIRRRDYLVNLLQSVLEIILFFNPAVLWVSHLIKTEREHCCDDIAISKNVTKVNYINALVTCEVLRTSKPAYGMAMVGSGNQLISRVRRMVNKRNNGLNIFEKTVLTLCLVISGIAFSAYTGKERIKEAALAIAKVIMPAESGLPIIAQKDLQSKLTIAGDTVDKSKLAIIQHSAVDSMVASGLNFTTRYADSTKKVLLTEVKQETYNVMNFNRVNNAQDTGKSIKTTVTNKTTYTTASNVKGTISRYESLLRRDSMDRSYYDFSLDKNNNINDGLRHIPRTYNEQMALELVKDGIIAGDAVSMQRFSYSMKEGEFIVNGKKQPDEIAKKYAAMFDRHTNNPKYAAPLTLENSHILNRIVLEIVKDGIINNSNDALANLSFILNNNEFVVNGQKQPAGTFKKYFDTFVKTAPNGQMSWRYNMATK